MCGILGDLTFPMIFFPLSIRPTILDTDLHSGIIPNTAQKSKTTKTQVLTRGKLTSLPDNGSANYGEFVIHI